MYKNTRYNVELYEIKDGKIPDLEYVQVYAIGNLNNKVPVVKYLDTHKNLPGGGTEIGESVEQTLAREIKEELNMKVLSWFPLGVQKNINTETGEYDYSLRVYAEFEKIGEFTEDPGGSVIGYDLIDIEDLEKNINYKEVGEYFIRRLRKYYKKFKKGKK